MKDLIDALTGDTEDVCDLGIGHIAFGIESEHFIGVFISRRRRLGEGNGGGRVFSVSFTAGAFRSEGHIFEGVFVDIRTVVADTEEVLFICVVSAIAFFTKTFCPDLGVAAVGAGFDVGTVIVVGDGAVVDEDRATEGLGATGFALTARKDATREEVFFSYDEGITTGTATDIGRSFVITTFNDETTETGVVRDYAAYIRIIHIVFHISPHEV